MIDENSALTKKFREVSEEVFMLRGLNSTMHRQLLTKSSTSYIDEQLQAQTSIVPPHSSRSAQVSSLFDDDESVNIDVVESVLADKAGDMDTTTSDTDGDVVLEKQMHMCNEGSIIDTVIDDICEENGAVEMRVGPKFAAIGSNSRVVKSSTKDADKAIGKVEGDCGGEIPVNEDDLEVSSEILTFSSTASKRGVRPTSAKLTSDLRSKKAASRNATLKNRKNNISRCESDVVDVVNDENLQSQDCT